MRITVSWVLNDNTAQTVEVSNSGEAFVLRDYLVARQGVMFVYVT